MDILRIINGLRDTDRAIEVIFLHGSCYQFHLFLKQLDPQAIPLINNDKDHIITEINGKFYDITGEVEPIDYRPLRPNEIDMVQNWSFSKSRLLSLGDCPSCDEPILTAF